MKKPLVFVKLLNEGDTGSEEDRYNRHHNMNVGATTRGVFKAYAFFIFKNPNKHSFASFIELKGI